MACGPAFAALARKYRALLAIRREAAAGQRAPRAVLRALAAEFPGALRELDNLPERALAERAAALEEAARDPACTLPWMLPLAAYHALAWAALSIRRTLRSRRALAPGEAARLAAAASIDATLDAATGWSAPLLGAVPGASDPLLDVAFVEAVAAPPRGRLARAVLERVAAASGRSPEALDALLFPPHPGRAHGRKAGVPELP